MNKTIFIGLILLIIGFSAGLLSASHIKISGCQEIAVLLKEGYKTNSFQPNISEDISVAGSGADTLIRSNIWDKKNKKN